MSFPDRPGLGRISKDCSGSISAWIELGNVWLWTVLMPTKRKKKTNIATWL